MKVPAIQNWIPRPLSAANERLGKLFGVRGIYQDPMALRFYDIWNAASLAHDTECVLTGAGNPECRDDKHEERGDRDGPHRGRRPGVGLVEAI